MASLVEIHPRDYNLTSGDLTVLLARSDEGVWTYWGTMYHDQMLGGAQSVPEPAQQMLEECRGETVRSSPEDEAFSELEQRLPQAARRTRGCVCTPFGEVRACPVHGDDA